MGRGVRLTLQEMLNRNEMQSTYSLQHGGAALADGRKIAAYWFLVGCGREFFMFGKPPSALLVVLVLLNYFLPSILSLATLSSSRSLLWGKITPLFSTASTRRTRFSTNLSGMEEGADGDSQIFGRFQIPREHVFYETEKSCAIVNLRPIVPGHVLVVCKREGVTRMSALEDDEYADLWSTVRKVQKVVEGENGGVAANVAVQDGREAGQSVPHVHVHILPRQKGDFEYNDQVYEELEGWGPWKGKGKERGMDVPNDEDRRDRTEEVMAEEARSYRDKFI
jgi:bis(5'-adenosyl)-triphosphatase